VRDAVTEVHLLPLFELVASLHEAVSVRDKHAFNAVFVVADGRRLIGINDGDVRRAFLANAPGTTPVAAVMTAAPVVITAATSLAEAIEVMETAGRKVYVLPVVEAGTLVGALRMHDVVGG
jgi:arabinose-5-phosphate isomerase